MTDDGVRPAHVELDRGAVTPLGDVVEEIPHQSAFTPGKTRCL